MSSEWISRPKLTEESGASRGLIDKILSSGEVKFAKSKDSKTSKLFIHLPSWNQFWSTRSQVK